MLAKPARFALLAVAMNWSVGAWADGDAAPSVPAANDAAAIDVPVADDIKPAPGTDVPEAPEPIVDESAGNEIAKLYPVDNEDWLKDPFLVLDMEMEAVISDFGEGRSKPPAETTQPRIVSRFDSLIALLEKSCNGSGTGSGGGPRPAQASVIRKGPGGMGELRAPKTSGRGFEDLTPKERERILQSKTEGFPPGFEDVLADYYRRLSKAEQSDPVPADDAPAPGGAGSE